MFLSLTNDLNAGEARPLVQYQDKKFLANDNGSYKIGNNVCPHQSSRIISEKTDNLKCQYHGWSWDMQGTPTGAGYTTLCNDKKLTMVDVFEHQGMVFNKPISLPEFPINFDNFFLKTHRVDRVKTENPMHIMNIFLDVDHIPLVHKRVYEKNGIIGNPSVEWEYFDNGSIQKVYHSNTRDLIFMWVAIYPFTMIEWQPGSLFITDCFNSGDGYTDVAVYKYRENFTSQYEYEISQTTWETAWSQDKFQSEQMVAINSAMFEEPKQHYLDWKNMNGTGL